ncbi:hypothetical protein ACOME3_000672 [Neoechinorhynchus agilis]
MVDKSLIIHHWFKKQADVNKQNRPIEEIQRETLKRGLDIKIEKTNRGYEMMRKMGYKDGLPLGKTTKGIIEPIKPELKESRSGLGRVPKVPLKDGLKEEKDFLEDRRSFVERKQNEFIAKRIAIDLAKSRRMCQTLDLEEQISEPVDPLFWPQDQIEERETDEVDNDDILQRITSYLRQNYYYCIWCSVRFNNNDDLANNCPGNTFDEH